jgi:hypothetical protein
LWKVYFHIEYCQEMSKNGSNRKNRKEFLFFCRKGGGIGTI